MEEEKKSLIYLLHKCSLLYIHLDSNTKRDVLHHIRDFILKLQNRFDVEAQLKELDPEAKRKKVLSILIPYLQQLTSGFMVEHIQVDEEKKEFLIHEIDVSSRKKIYEISDTSTSSNKAPEIKEEKKSIMKEHMVFVTQKITNHIDEKVVLLQDELNRFFEKKFESLKSENHKDLHHHTKEISHSFEKIRTQIQDEIYQLLLDKNQSYLHENYDKIRDEIRDKIMYDLERNMKDEIYQKVEKLTHILNKSLEASLQRSTQLSQEEIQEFVSNKIHEYECMIKNTPYMLHYDKVYNTIQFRNGNDVISSITLPPLPVGVPGPPGPTGAAGSTPKFQKLDVSKDGYLSIVVQDEKGSYELRSSNPIPIQKEKDGEKEVIHTTTTKSVHDLSFDKAHVMRLDSNYSNTLIILKSLSIGEHSHTLRPNSVAIGGATCFQEHSLALGEKSQTLSKNNIALFGSTSGENAFAYMAHNVGAHQWVVGEQKSQDSYNIQKIVLNANEIQMNGNHVSIRAYDEKIKSLESKIAVLERALSSQPNTSQGSTEQKSSFSIFPSTFVQDRFFN